MQLNQKLINMLIKKKITPINGKQLLKGFLPSEFLKAFGFESKVTQHVPLWLLSKLHIYIGCLNLWGT